MSNEKSKRFIIIIIILLIILVVMFCSYLYLSNRKNRIPYDGPVENARVKEVDTKTDNVLNLSGFGVFFDKYSGEYKSSEIAYFLEEVHTEFLPQMCEELKDCNGEEIANYYQTNRYTIKNHLGHSSESDFVEFVENLTEKNVDQTSWDNLSVLKETFVDESSKKGYAYAEYEVTYIDDSVIKFSLFIPIEKSTGNIVINIAE